VCFSCSPPGFDVRYANADLGSGGLFGDEGEPELAKQCAALVIGLCCRHDRDVKSTDAINLVLVNFVKHGLFRESEGVVSVSVKLTV
jgi:hypothetical protein